MRPDPITTMVLTFPTYNAPYPEWLWHSRPRQQGRAMVLRGWLDESRVGRSYAVVVRARTFISHRAPAESIIQQVLRGETGRVRKPTRGPVGRPPSCLPERR